MRATSVSWMLCLVFIGLLCGCPESFHRDDQGHPHGTGAEVFHYPNGKTRARTDFVSGSATKTVWFRPDGSVVAETRWNAGRGTGYELRNDGTIHASGPVVDELRDGEWKFYKGDGEIDKTVIYQRGHPQGNRE